MTFKLTHVKELTDEKSDYELLDDYLLDYAKSVNYEYWGWLYTSRVYFVVTETYNRNIRVSVSFKSEHMSKNPEKYGADFRKLCIHTIIDAADEFLDENRTHFMIIVREDFDAIEERFYARQ